MTRDELRRHRQRLRREWTDLPTVTKVIAVVFVIFALMLIPGVTRLVELAVGLLVVIAVVGAALVIFTGGRILRFLRRYPFVELGFGYLLGRRRGWSESRSRSSWDSGVLARWSALDPVAFKQAVADLLARSGWREVRHTGRSGDLGVDLVGITPQGLRAIVQCKRYSPSATIGSPFVHQLVASLHIYGGSEAWLVTTGGFTPDARRLGRRMGVVLVDGPGLVEMGRRTWQQRATGQRSQPGPRPWAAA